MLVIIQQYIPIKQYIMKRTKKLTRTIALSIALQVLTLLSLNLFGQAADRLPRSIPEMEGVSSAGITDFLNAVDTGRQEIHSFMLIRHGKVVAEGWWDPYGPEYKHLLYSASKTFTATAVGLAVTEGRLKTSDKVISFFPYSLPDSIGNYMRDLTVRDLLTMSVGQEQEPRAMGAAGDWISLFISTEPDHKPGTVFKYNNMATFMLSAIVQQVTGETTFDYLMPRIFKPLGIRGADWDLNPQGINLGMIGLRLRTEDLAKFGQLLLQEGTWNKKQLLPKEWVREATSFKIETPPPQNKLPKELSDGSQGYCYQMWRGRNNTVRLDGMAGQYVVLIPDKDAIVVMTANARNTQDQLNYMHNYLIPAIKSDKALPPDQAAYAELKKKQEALSIRPAVTNLPAPDLEKRISGKEFVLDNNDNNISSVYLAFDNGDCTFAIKRDNRISSIKAGSAGWKMSNGTSASLLNPPRSASKSVDANYTVPASAVKTGATFAWTDKSTLEITARFVEESLGAQTVVCRFTETGGNIRMTLGTKTSGPPSGGPGGQMQAAQLRGTMVDIK